MSALTRHTENATTALVLFACSTLALEALAFAWAWSGQIAGPFGFFTNQTWDFLVKAREFAGPLLSWTPSPPDHFSGTSVSSHLAFVITSAPATLCMAVLMGLLGGTLASLIASKRELTLRSWLLLWTILAVAVHVAASIAPLNLGQMSRWGQLGYRLRSLVIDGTAIAGLVTLASFGLSWFLAPSTNSKGGRLALGIGALGLAVGGATLSPPANDNAVAAFTPAAAAAQAKTNVLLISLDSLRADHVHAYGYERETSPTIDRLANEGIRFANAISTSSWTLPTHLTMFTSRYQTSHGVTVDTLTLNPAIPTLGEIMKSAGYATAGFISGPYVAGHYGYGRGMDTYVDLSQGYDHRAEARATIASPVINEQALEWLDEHKEQPFFLFLHYFDIHYDFIPPAPYDTMFDPDYTGTMDGTRFIERKDVNARMDPRDLEHIKALYDGEIRFTDEHVGKILERLEALDLLENTIVMLVSDHGDEFFEHGNKGHHRTVYDEVLRVPFVVRLPGKTHAGTVIEEQASLVDVMPTLLAQTQIPGPVDMEGENLLNLLEGQPLERDAIYAEFYDKRGFNVQVAQRTAKTKVIQHFNRITHPSSKPVELYDVAKDPEEQNDLAGTEAARETDALERLSDWLNLRWSTWRGFQSLGGSDTEGVEIDDEMAKRLMQLGYISDE